MKWADLQSLLIKCDNEFYGRLPDLQFYLANLQSTRLPPACPVTVIYAAADTAVLFYETGQLIMMH